MAKNRNIFRHMLELTLTNKDTRGGVK